MCPYFTLVKQMQLKAFYKQNKNMNIVLAAAL